MSKYKVGDKVVYEVKEIIRDGAYLFPSWKEIEPLPTDTEPLEAKIQRQAAEITRLLRENAELKEESKRNYTINIEMARAEGHSEAWELARKIAVIPKDGGYGGSKLIEIFNTALNNEIFNLTYPEAAAKVAEWEKAKEEIKVGDVFQDDDGNNAIVTSIKGNTIYYMWDDGDTRSGFAEDVKKHFTKTGRHIDIDSFLKQIGGNENER